MTGLEPLILIGASTAMTMMGQIQQTNQAVAMANYNRKVAENDAIASRNAGIAESERLRAAARRLRGTSRARMGAAGMVDTTGSPLLLLAANARDAEMDRLTLMQQAEIQAQRNLSRASMEKMKAKGYKAALPLKLGSTLLSGASSAYGYSSQTASAGGAPMSGGSGYDRW